MTVPQTGAWAPSHIVFHSQGPGWGGEGEGYLGRWEGGPGGRVFQFMGSVETTTPINAFFQSPRLWKSVLLRIWASGWQRRCSHLVKNPQCHSYLCLLGR